MAIHRKKFNHYVYENESILKSSPATTEIQRFESGNGCDQSINGFEDKKVPKNDNPTGNISPLSESGDNSDSEIALEKTELKSDNGNVDSSINQKHALKRKREETELASFMNDLREITGKLEYIGFWYRFMKEQNEKLQQNEISLKKAIEALIVKNNIEVKKLKNNEFQFQKICNIVQDNSSAEIKVEKVKAALGIPGVVSFDSEIKQEIKEEIKTEVLDEETTSSLPFYSNSQHWTSAHKGSEISGNNLENLSSLSHPFPPHVVLPTITTPLEVSQIQNLKLIDPPPKLIQSMPTTVEQSGPSPKFFKIVGGKPVQIGAPNLQIFPVSGGQTGQRPQFF